MPSLICDYEGCQRPAHPALFIYGCGYCEDHYFFGLQRAFFEQLTSLVPEKPSSRFRNLFGRYTEAIYKARGAAMPEELTGNKLRDRAESIKYDGNAITFTLVRHPKPIPIQQQWRFYLDKKELVLVDEEPAFFGCEEAGTRLGVTAKTVRRYIKQGRIKAQRASATQEIDDWFDDKLSRSDYDAYIRRNRTIRPNKWLISKEELHRFLKEN